MPVPAVLTKRPNESILYTFDYQYLLALPTESINGVVTIEQEGDSEPPGGDDLTIGTPAHNSATKAQARISGGGDNDSAVSYLYKVVCRVTTTDGNTREDVGRLRVENY